MFKNVKKMLGLTSIVCGLQVFSLVNAQDVLDTSTLPTDLPQIPQGCFSDQDYCFNYGVNTIAGRKLIRVNLFAKVYGYKDIAEIRNIYTDYAKWGDYADRSGTGDVRFVNSVALPPLIFEGVQRFPHFADYVVAGPLGRTFPTKELAYNWIAPTAAGADMTLMFTLAPTPYNIPDFGGVKGPSGIAYKAGILHIRHNKETNEYYLYSVTDVVPTVPSLIFRIADQYIAKGILSIFIGMFEL